MIISFSFSQTEDKILVEEEIIPVTQTDPIYPSALIIDWNSEYLIEAKKN